MRMTLAQVLRATDAELVASERTEDVGGISADSRRVRPGELFVAIRGGQRDGHDFVREAFDRGAAGMMVERWPLEGFPGSVDCSGKPLVLKVRDSLYALGQLAAFARRGLAAKVVAITGTAGKTTTKQMTAGVLGAAVGTVFRTAVGASEGSENNLVGLPLTILRADGLESALVLEMGMNALGEIARMTEIADPDVGLVTNIGLAHLRPSATSLSLAGGPRPLNSLAGVIEAKGELWAGMRRDGVAIVNLDDLAVARLAGRRGGPRLTFSRHLELAPDVGCEAVEERGAGGQRFILRTGGERAAVELAVAGEHNLSNALAAAAIGVALEVPAALIAQGLGRFRPLAMRSEVITLGPDVLCINDAYNANPLSMAAALKMLAAMPGARRIAALGDMRELGEAAPGAHRELGALVARLPIERLLAVGEFAAELAAGAREGGMARARVGVFPGPAELGLALGELLQAGDRLLLKGSRAVGLEVALERLRRAGPR